MYGLPDPFMVIATQNSMESHGVVPLPDSLQNTVSQIFGGLHSGSDFDPEDPAHRRMMKMS
jgi:hypothetical protein